MCSKKEELKAGSNSTHPESDNNIQRGEGECVCVGVGEGEG